MFVNFTEHFVEAFEKQFTSKMMFSQSPTVKDVESGIEKNNFKENFVINADK